LSFNSDQLDEVVLPAPLCSCQSHRSHSAHSILNTTYHSPPERTAISSKQILRIQLLEILEVPPAIISHVSKLSNMKPALDIIEDIDTLIDLDGVATTLGE
jgi:hypothetical protein